MRIITALNMSTKESVKEILLKGMHPLWQRVHANLVSDFSGRFEVWQKGPNVAGSYGEADFSDQVVRFLSGIIYEGLERIVNIKGLLAEYTTRYNRAESNHARNAVVMDFALALDPDIAKVKGDRKALSRWFGFDAVVERCRKRLALSEREISLALNRLGSVVSLRMKRSGESEGYEKIWRRAGIEKTLAPLLVYEGDGRVVVEAFRTIASALAIIPKNHVENIVDVSIVQYVYRAALEYRKNIWLQIAALRLLEIISPGSLADVLRRHLTVMRSENDQIFLRRRVVLVLKGKSGIMPEYSEFLHIAVKDSSPYVRQAAVSVLKEAGPDLIKKLFIPLALGDSSLQVRAAALLQVPLLLESRTDWKIIEEVMQKSLEKETDIFVVRVLLKVCVEGMKVIIHKGDPSGPGLWTALILPHIIRIHRESPVLALRRQAALAREQLWSDSNGNIRELKAAALKLTTELDPARGSIAIPDPLASAQEDVLGRVLSVLAQEDFGFEIEHGIFRKKIIRGHRFGFRLWRMFYELVHPSPDKRQAHSHTSGRIFTGDIHIPSAIMAELTETKVPGEPLYMASEGGWRPYLPLMDAVVSSLQLRKSFRIITSEGITEIRPPRNPLKRMRAGISFTLRFAAYAEARNWKETQQTSPEAYVMMLKQQGFKIKFTGHQTEDGQGMEDPAVRRFFPAVIPFSGSGLWERMTDYFFSVYENSLDQLVVFSLLMAVLFIGQSFYKSFEVKKARAKFPVVIGGWGTRGKSGTERLKAALINALGFSTISKTTGCEAMFLHAYPYGSLKELFLFRPYDKATIWEQYDLIKLAAKLDTDFMLWECMALTPEYVSVLQGSWQGDDISTITNAYPDHEDIQGPAGINIPEVMTKFIPESSVLISTEELMSPILKQGAYERNTRFRQAGWLQAGLLTEDVLDRFSYEEHPFNIALVLELASELGIEEDFALKEMSDRVIPDIGVLKIYPEAEINLRRLQFINGMSANDRFGCLANWERTGLTAEAVESSSGNWITTIVNNRADRVARSKVFAQIIVEDIRADRHFLIGSNLKGLKGEIKRNWEDHAEQIMLWPEGGTKDPIATAEHYAGVLRIPTDESRVSGFLKRMLAVSAVTLSEEQLEGVLKDPGQMPEMPEQDALREDILLCFKGYLEQYKEFRDFAEKLRHAGSGAHKLLEKEFRALITKWFMAKFVVIEDYHASGEAIINEITECTPPGHLNRIMGMQNIKGTGLDFVYRWQAWDKCYSACEMLGHPKREEAEAGLRQLSAFHDFGLLCEQYVYRTIESVRPSTLAQSERFQAELSVIESNLGTAMKKVSHSMNVTEKPGFLHILTGFIESFMDAGESIRRRKASDRIYRDLVDERISHERAAIELQKINKEQKGGWLSGQFGRLIGRSS